MPLLLRHTRGCEELINRVQSGCAACLGMEALLECSAFIDKLRKDPAYTKEDVLDSMETRMSFLVGKMATSPTCMPFKIFPDPAES